jgi:protein-tyrosine phosphatase
MPFKGITPVMTSETATPQRVLQLPSGHNFRDLGGYRTEDGRTIRWRQLFRSGFMSRVTGDDATALNALSIDTICDFRANDERDRRPTAWHHGSKTELWARDYDFSAGAMFELIRRPGFVARDMHATMVGIYRILPFEQADSFREVLARLAAGRVPLLFNCSAGKDRTGLAAALILSVLGVSRDVILDDYLLTNEVIEGLAAFMASEPKYGAFVNERREHAMPLLRAEPEYLATAFEVIEQKHGTMNNYLNDVLGLSMVDQDAIRDNLLI